MQADEAQYQPAQTDLHMTPIIKQITQLSLADSKKIQMPSVSTVPALACDPEHACTTRHPQFS